MVYRQETPSWCTFPSLREREPDAVITPVMGRAVIFRKSIALYYSTSRETGHFGGDTSTHWKTHGPRLTGLRLATFETLIFLSRAFAKIAHTIDPNKAP